MKSVTRAFLRELFRHRALAALQILGVACGVAAAVGMSLSASTALASFSRAVAFLQGAATHTIQRPAGPLEETLLPALARDPAVRALAPALDRRLRLASGEQVRLLGVDPFLDAALRPDLFAGAAGGEDARGRFRALLGEPPAVLLERSLAGLLALAPGASLASALGPLRLAGLFTSPTGEPLAVMDIGQAQRLLGASGFVDRVDLVLDDETGFRRRWGEGFQVQSGRERSLTMEAMLGAFRVNLQALSLLALLVGVFLVYNTAMFTVVSRRHDAGVLRSLGAGRGEIAAAFCVEILLLGVAGGALGGTLGYLLARLLTGTVGGTISTLYFFLRPAPPVWSWWIPAAGAGLGCVAGMLGALAPLVALARTVPVQLLGRRAPGRDERRSARAAAVAGCVLAAASLVALALPGSGVVAGIAGSFGVLLGLILCTGEALLLLGPALEGLLTRLGGLPGKMASGFIRRSLGRTAVATAAFTVALSMSIGLGTLIGSFRRSLDHWMESQINADIYVGKAVEGVIPAAFAEGLRALPGIAGLDLYRYVPILFRGLPAHLQAVDAAVLQRFARFRWVRGGDEQWEAVRRGEVIVTESFARRFGVRAGERIVLEGRGGARELAVAGVFYDYTSEHGVVMMDRATYLGLSGDPSVNTVGVYLEPGSPQRAATTAAVRSLAAERGYPVQLREELHRGIREVFDATFAVTRSLRLLAVVTAFFGIAGALLTLFTERRREYGVFRALGFSSGQVVGVTLLEGLGLGLASFALSARLGDGRRGAADTGDQPAQFQLDGLLPPGVGDLRRRGRAGRRRKPRGRRLPRVARLAHLPPDPTPGGMMQAAEKGLAAAATRPPDRRAPCTRTFLSSLSVQRGVRIAAKVVVAGIAGGLVSMAAAGGAAAGEWAAADGTRTWTFPRDHGAHPEYRTEWWYFTGILAAADGRRFGYQLTFFRQGMVPVAADPGNPWSVRDLHLAHFTLTDVRERSFRFGERISRAGPGLAGAAVDALRAWVLDWSAAAEGSGFTLEAREGDVAIRLSLRPRRPPVLHGFGGLSRKGPAVGQASWYASVTDLETTGTVRAGGEGEVAVQGASWFDHEFGSGQLADDLAGWDWFGLRLSDGRALMIYRLRRRDGTVAPASAGTLVGADGTARHLAGDDVAIEALATWRSPHSGASYPARWRLRVPAAGIALELSPLLPDQELRTGRSTGVTYWEGAVGGRGTGGGTPVTVEGYAELTGYAGGMGGLF